MQSQLAIMISMSPVKKGTYSLRMKAASASKQLRMCHILWETIFLSQWIHVAGTFYEDLTFPWWKPFVLIDLVYVAIHLATSPYTHFPDKSPFSWQGCIAALLCERVSHIFLTKAYFPDRAAVEHYSNYVRGSHIFLTKFIFPDKAAAVQLYCLTFSWQKLIFLTRL